MDERGDCLVIMNKACNVALDSVMATQPDEAMLYPCYNSCYEGHFYG